MFQIFVGDVVHLPKSGPVFPKGPADRPVHEWIVHIAHAVRHDDCADRPWADAGRAAPESPFRPARRPEERTDGRAGPGADVSLGNGLSRGIDTGLVSELGVIEPFGIRELEIVNVRPHAGGRRPAALAGSEPVLEEKPADPPYGVEAVHIAAGGQEGLP